MPSKEYWNLERIKEGFDIFYKEYGRYPTTTEFDNFEFLPSSRQIQRKFGGLVKLRELLKLKTDFDLTKGKHSSNRAKKINKRAYSQEKEVYDYLIDRFGLEFVHREYFFTDDSRTRVDFFVYYKKGQFAVDTFYASDRRNLLGCLNNKLSKYKKITDIKCPTIFIQMNRGMNQDLLDDVVRNKKNSLNKNQYLMTLESFKEFCKDKDSNKVL